MMGWSVRRPHVRFPRFATAVHTLDGEPLPNLGVHEHWSDPIHRLYKPQQEP